MPFAVPYELFAVEQQSEDVCSLAFANNWNYDKKFGLYGYLSVFIVPAQTMGNREYILAHVKITCAKNYICT